MLVLKRTLVHFHYYSEVTYPTSHSPKSYGRVADGENFISLLFLKLVELSINKL
jgi:hypothetical protein